MFRWALVFFIISIISGMMGFTGVAARSAAIAKGFFFIATALFVVFLIAGLTVARAMTRK